MTVVEFSAAEMVEAVEDAVLFKRIEAKISGSSVVESSKLVVVRLDVLNEGLILTEADRSPSNSWSVVFVRLTVDVDGF